MDVKRLTMAVQLMAAQVLDIKYKLDNDMFNHVSFVVNRSLIILRDEGASRDSIEKCGKFLWRLIRVTQAYNAKKRDVTLDEIINIAQEFKDVFGI